MLLLKLLLLVAVFGIDLVGVFEAFEPMLLTEKTPIDEFGNYCKGTFQKVTYTRARIIPTFKQ